MNFIDGVILAFLVYLLISSFWVNLLRLSGISFLSENYQDLVLLTAGGLAGLNVLFSFRSRLPNFALLFLFTLFLIYIYFLGTQTGSGSALIGLKYYILPLIICLLLWGRNYLPVLYINSWIWYAVLISHILGFIYYYFALRGTVYPGIGVQSIALAGLFFFCRKNYPVALLCFLLIFLEGKRNIMLSLLVTLPLISSIHYASSKRIFFLAIATLFSAMIIFLFLWVAASYPENLFFARINNINPLSDNFDLFLGSSGRMGELVSYFQNLTIYDILRGNGSGYEYVWDLGYDSEQGGEVKGYFHMTAANYLAAGGVLGLGFFFWICSQIFKAAQLAFHPIYVSTAFAFGVFCIIQSFFGFNLAVDVISPVMILGPMAYVSQFAPRPKKVKLTYGVPPQYSADRLTN
jgi:hypothetical protein